MKHQEKRNRVWFTNGQWRYYSAARGRELDISSLLRKHGFQREKIAKALNLSERSFHRLILDSLDITPGYWLRRERAVHARYCLRCGASVKELAIELGFKHPGDFSKEFKLWHGVPPQYFIAAAHAQEMDRRRTVASHPGED